jgi:hypothetical protein
VLRYPSGVETPGSSRTHRIRHRLSRGSDRQLIVRCTPSTCTAGNPTPQPATRSRGSRRGKTSGEATRVLKPYVARHLFRVMRERRAADDLIVIGESVTVAQVNGLLPLNCQTTPSASIATDLDLAGRKCEAASRSRRRTASHRRRYSLTNRRSARVELSLPLAGAGNVEPSPRFDCGARGRVRGRVLLACTAARAR